MLHLLNPYKPEILRMPAPEPPMVRAGSSFCDCPDDIAWPRELENQACWREKCSGIELTKRGSQIMSLCAQASGLEHPRAAPHCTELSEGSRIGGQGSGESLRPPSPQNI